MIFWSDKDFKLFKHRFRYTNMDTHKGVSKVTEEELKFITNFFRIDWQSYIEYYSEDTPTEGFIDEIPHCTEYRKDLFTISKQIGEEYELYLELFEIRAIWQIYSGVKYDASFLIPNKRCVRECFFLFLMGVRTCLSNNINLSNEFEKACKIIYSKF